MNEVDYHSKSCNGPLGKINLLGIFFGLQTTTLIGTLPDRKGKKNPQDPSE